MAWVRVTLSVMEKSFFHGTARFLVPVENQHQKPIEITTGVSNLVMPCSCLQFLLVVDKQNCSGF